MNIFENFNKAKQKFGENLARQAIEAKIPNQFVYAACKFNVENGTPFNDLYLLFSQWTTYVVSKNANINVDVLDYNTFWKTIQDYKKQYGEEGKVYDDGTVSITHISSLEQMKKLPIKNLWCIRREKHWNEYQENGARFYLITNNNYSDESNCRYVMVEMYANGEIGYWSTDNELIDAESSTKRLPPLAEYQKTLGGALQKIQELQRKITENKRYTNMNKKLIRLTESDLHKIVKESVDKVLTELDWRTYANAAKKSREQDRYGYGGHNDRTRAFDRATEKALNTQYGGRHSVNTDDEHLQRFHSYSDNPFSTEYDAAWRPLDGYEDEWSPYADTVLNKPGSKDISDFVNGRNKYAKGKGWQ